MENENNIRIIDFQSNIDNRGKLIVAEEYKDLPFHPKRLFYIYDVNDDKSRGNHANIDSEFVMIAIRGSVKINATDGVNQYEYILDDPSKGLYLPKLTWKTMSEFSDDCVLLVIASTLFNKEEYIGDYQKYLEYVKKR